MSRILSFCILLFFVTNLSAQVNPEQQSEAENGAQTSASSKKMLFGKLVDINSGKPIEAASVQLFPGPGEKADSLLDGMLTKPNGEFSFQNAVPAKSYKLVISALVYQHY